MAAKPENPLLKNVTHLESVFNFDHPKAKNELLNWFPIFDSFPSIEDGLNGRLTMLTNIWRQCPVIFTFEKFHRTNKEPFSIMEQYQYKGEWLHTERRAKEIKALADKTHPFVLLIENFARKGNITAVTNSLYLFDKEKIDIPWHISFEALFWAELIQAKQILEKEEENGKQPKVRIKDTGKEDKESAAKHDPFYHLYCAYLLLREFETTEEINAV